MRKNHWRIAGLGLVAVGLLAAWACIRRPMKMPQPQNKTNQLFLMPQSAERDLDLLFMIDNSDSMLNEQNNLRAQFSILMDALKRMRGGLPNIHIGVVSSDLGAGTYTQIGGCQTVGGDKGVLGQVGGVNRGDTAIGSGQRYIVDVEPKGCRIDKTPLAEGVRCNSSDCGQANCDQAAGANESLTLVTDPDTGCPRCRNYTGTLEDAFSNYAALGTGGCGFEHQLEAVRLALDTTSTPQNTGFLRDSAFLSVIWISDEDDCSASDPQTLFNPDPNLDNINSALGYLTSFRCFEFGITCDVNDRTVVGPRHNCVPREDAQALLYPVSRYTSFLEALKDPLLMVIAAIAGPVPDVINVTTDNGRPALDFSCHDPQNPNEGAVPGVRIRSVVGYFNAEDDMNQWAYTSVCSTDFSSALAGIGNKLADAMSEKCMLQPFAGCTAGPGGTQCAPCLPTCTVYDVEQRNTDQQKVLMIPWCGNVCQNGMCTPNDLQACEYDQNGKCTCPSGLYPTKLGENEGCAPLFYANADPELDRDPTLAQAVPRQEPTCVGQDCPAGTEGQASACWYMSSDTTCEFGAGFKIVRAEDPPPRTFAQASCALVPAHEALCNDGKDNDEDCLVDTADPDCAQN